MSDRRLDLGPLDPAQDRLRWERLVRDVAARGAAGAARRRPGSLSVQLATWIRPAMACAAAAALVAWAPALFQRPPQGVVPSPAAGAAGAPSGGDPAARLAAWADRDDGDGAALILALGDSDDAR